MYVAMIYDQGVEIDHTIVGLNDIDLLEQQCEVEGFELRTEYLGSEEWKWDGGDEF